MSTKEVQEGKRLDFTNSGSAISSGDVVVIGEGVGVAISDIAASTGVGAVHTEGVFQLAKVTGTAFSQGDRLFWDTSNAYLTKTATGNKYAGMCTEAASSGATSAKVKLDPQAKQAAVVAALAQTISGTYSQSEVQAISTTVDAILSALKAAGLMANS